MFRQLPRFLLVGALAFAVDFTVMALLVYGLVGAESTGMLVVSRIAAWFSAIVVAFFVNARFTFAVLPGDSSFWRYLVIQGVGGLINLSVYTLLIVSVGANWPLLSMAVGSAVATLSNYLLVRHYVFHGGG